MQGCLYCILWWLTEDPWVSNCLHVCHNNFFPYLCNMTLVYPLIQELTYFPSRWTIYRCFRWHIVFHRLQIFSKGCSWCPYHIQLVFTDIFLHELLLSPIIVFPYSTFLFLTSEKMKNQHVNLYDKLGTKYDPWGHKYFHFGGHIWRMS